MKSHPAVNVALCLLIGGVTLSTAPAALAQQPGQTHSPSKYIYLANEAIKPGMASAVIKNESSQVQALRTAKAPVHYLGLTNITGAPRAIFIAGYDSFAQMQKEHQQTMSDTKLQDALKADNATEGPMLAQTHGSIYEYRKDLSLRPDVDLSQMRFFDMTLYEIKNGHHQDFERLAKLYAKAYSSVPDAHWAVFEKDYGEDSGSVFIAITPLKSLAGVDQEMLDGNNLPKTAGADQLQVMRELGSVTVKSAESDLFAVVPQMSYVPASWLTASPDFWGKK